MRVTFEEVSYRAAKSGRCACGKQRTRQRKFWGTINPFNKNTDGSIRTRSEIYTSLKQQAADWKLEPITCAKCEISSHEPL